MSSPYFRCKPCGDHAIIWKNVLPSPATNERFTVMDLDGFTERKGRFLFLEWKELNGSVDLTSGNGLALSRLAEHHPVIIVWGVSRDERVDRMQRLGVDPEPINCVGVDAEDSPFVIAYQQWYEWADKGTEGPTW